MATEKGMTIANYASGKLGCAYIYGGYGERKCTPSFRKERAKAYPEYKAKMYQYCPVLSGKQSACTGCKYDGKSVYDCAQLTRYSCKAAGQELVSGANSQWTKTAWEQKGTIDSLPDAPGVILYHVNENGRMSHTGVYVGGGYAVEARGHAYGVVKTAVSSRSWTHWAALPGVLEGSELIDVAPAAKPKEDITQKPATPEKAQNKAESVVHDMKTLRINSTGTQVKVLQWLLNDTVDFTCGKADGIFGTQTLTAVRRYQEANGLTVDGVVGKNTWKKLLG